LWLTPVYNMLIIRIVHLHFLGYEMVECVFLLSLRLCKSYIYVGNYT